ncbi:MAG: hypothetical protein KAS64_06735 [Spirochaetes bacterium]|nr:hypothetical protein [Spirochaetota bacterium]
MNLKRIILLICIFYFPITGLFSGDLKNLRKKLKKIEKEDKENNNDVSIPKSKHKRKNRKKKSKKKNKSKDSKYKHQKFNTKNPKQNMTNKKNESWSSTYKLRFGSHPYQYPVFYFQRSNRAYIGKEWYASLDINYGYWGKNLSSIDIISSFTHSIFSFHLEIRSWNEILADNKNDNLVFSKFLFGFNFIFEDNYSFELLFGAQVIDHKDNTFGSGGFKLSMFPAQPLIIDISMFLGVKNWTALLEFGIRLGIIINRFDVGIGYRAFSLENNNSFNGLLFSVRTWF